MYRILTVLIFCMFATTASAQFVGPGRAGQPITVAQVADARLGSIVAVAGNIIKRQRANYYTFRDETGEIRVEISRAVWRGREVRPETKVKLTGEVERGFFGRYLDVKAVRILK